MLAALNVDENADRELFALQLKGKQLMEEFGILLEILEANGTEARFSDVEPGSKNNLANMTKQFIKAALEYPLLKGEPGDDYCYAAFKLELPYLCIINQLSAWSGNAVPLEKRLQYMAYYFAIYGRVFDAAEQAWAICELGDTWIFFDEFQQVQYMAWLRQAGLLKALPH
jgi:hypothetical protein